MDTKVILNWIKEYYDPLLPIKETMTWADIESFTDYWDDTKIYTNEQVIKILNK